MVVKKGNTKKSVKKEKKVTKAEKPKVNKKVETKVVEKSKTSNCKKGNCKFKDIFSNQYFIIGLIVLIIVVLGLAFAFSSNGSDTKDTNTGADVISDKVTFTVYADYMSPSLAKFYDENLGAFLAQHPGVELKFNLYGGIENLPDLGGFDFGEGKKAKLAEMCAKAQGKEDEMISALLKSANKDHNGTSSIMDYSYNYYYTQTLPGIYTDDKINAYVSELGLDKSKFDVCYNSEDNKKIVDAEIQTVYNDGLLSLDPVFTYNGDKFSMDILDSVLNNIALGQPIKPSVTVAIIGKTGLSYFDKQNVNKFDSFDYYYEVTTRIIDADSSEGKDLVSKLGIESFPAYLFEGQFTDSPFYEGAKEVIDNDQNILGLYKTASLAKIGFESYYVMPDISGTLDNILSQDYSLGNKDANLKIIEFSDYLCPYCIKFNTESYEKLKAEYVDTGKALFYYLQRPILQLHPTSPLASLGALCAGEQGQYWAFHDKVFGYATEYDENNIREVAQNVNLDMGKFNDCYTKNDYDLEIQDIANLAESLGLSGTPSFLIGHVLVPGAVDYSVFKEIIDYELAHQ